MAQEKRSVVWQVFRFGVLGGLILTVFLLLWKPAPPAVVLTPEQLKHEAASFESKLQEIEAAQQSGAPATIVKFTSEEVNSFVTEAAERAKAVPAASPEEAEARAQIKSTQVAFVGDEVIAQAVAVRYGQDVYVTVRGRLGAENGYLKFMPTGFKIGQMTIPVAMVEGKLQEKLSEPENREKLKLPEFVADLRIEDGKLVLTPR